MINVSVVVGNPKPRSRTRRVAEVLVDKLLQPGSFDLQVIDLVDHVSEIFEWPSERMGALNARVASSHLAIFASPTYKATYTGLLKAFLDRYPACGLTGVTAIPLLTGADQTHSMGPNVYLAPLLVELGAVVPGSGFYFEMPKMGRIDEVVEKVAADYSRRLVQLAEISAVTRSHKMPDLQAGS